MCFGFFIFVFLFCKQKTAYEMRISDWSSDVCSSDLSARTTGALNLATLSMMRSKSPSTPKRPWNEEARKTDPGPVLRLRGRGNPHQRAHGLPRPQRYRQVGIARRDPDRDARRRHEPGPFQCPVHGQG